MFKRPDKKSFLYLGIVLVVAILVGVGYFYYLKKTEIKEVPEEKKPAEKTMEEIIKDLSAPEGEQEPLPEGVIESLSAPPQKGKEALEDLEDVLKSLSAPE